MVFKRNTHVQDAGNVYATTTTFNHVVTPYASTKNRAVGLRVHFIVRPRIL